MTPVVIQEELQAATYASLRAHATSEQARALVVKLSSMVEEYTIQTKSRQRKRRDTAGKLEYATGAFLADLLRPYEADEPNGWVYKSLNKSSFTGKPVGRHAFSQLYNGLEGLGFLQHVPGHKASDERSDIGKYAARFRATPELMAFCTEQGVPPKAVLDHFEFEYDLPEHPVALRARKQKSFFRTTDIPGKPMEFERTPLVQGMEGDVSELNEFLAKFTLRGGAHEGYVRIFQNGDDPDFNWNKGGRLYSQHSKGSYQVKPSSTRRKMTINGEPVAEIDISGSYGYLEVRCLGCDTHQTVALDVVRRPKATPIHELERYMRCKDCSQVRRYAYKRSHLVALRTRKISASDQASTWWPGER
jgi:hypothetical protein